LAHQSYSASIDLEGDVVENSEPWERQQFVANLSCNPLLRACIGLRRRVLDRPNALKGFAYYTLPWKGNSNTTTLGLFQVAYQGSPVSSYSDIGYGNGSDPVEATYLFGRGQFVNATADPSGAISLGSPYARRTPWYTQTDLNLGHAIKVNKNNEHQVLSFNATLANVLNQHAVVAYWGSLDSTHYASKILPNGQSIFGGAAFYQSAETGYNPATDINAGTVVKSSLYGQPNLWQTARRIRLGAAFTF
jgi:hypothetical protein